MKIMRLSKSVTMGLAVFIGILLALVTQSAKGTSLLTSTPLEELRIYLEVLKKTKQAYVEEVDDKKLIELSLQGMLSNLDPHSNYYSKNDFEQFQQKREGIFCGIGVEMEWDHKNRTVTIVAPIEGSPAQKAGIRSGDMIIKIDNKATSHMSLSQIIDSIRGKPHTKVIITILRDNAEEPFNFVIMREIIREKSVHFSLFEKDYGYLGIKRFQGNTHQDFVNAIEALYQQNKANLKGLVLDLRNNPGGVVQSAVGISSIFLPKGSLVLHTKGRLRNTQEFYASEKYYKTPKQKGDINQKLPRAVKEVPLVVLINHGSASASEIVAGALQDHQRSHIMGTRSFGKGSVQTSIPLSNGGAIKLTIAYYFTPKNRSIQAKGINPDTVVEDKMRPSFVEHFNVREVNLKGHLRNPHDNSGNTQEEQLSLQTPVNSTQISQRPSSTQNGSLNWEEDYQLKQALAYLKKIQAPVLTEK